MEHNKIIELLQECGIIDYYRNIDDILIIYNQNITCIDGTLTDINKLNGSLKFTQKTEGNN
jgi:hypothetical protein